MTVNCKTPGLTIEWGASGSFLYANVAHQSSGLYVRKFTSKPIEGGKRRFAAKVDAALSGIDWTRSPEELAKDAEAIKGAVYAIPYGCRA